MHKRKFVAASALLAPFALAAIFHQPSPEIPDVRLLTGDRPHNDQEAFY